jgi:hypothetical protein
MNCLLTDASTISGRWANFSRELKTHQPGSEANLLATHCLPVLYLVRAELVDGRLGTAFARWYPGFAGERQCYQVGI